MSLWACVLNRRKLRTQLLHIGAIHTTCAPLPIAMALPAQCDIVFKRTVTVELPKGSPWALDALETIDGTEFAVLKHRDIGFCRFVAGSYSAFRNNSYSFLSDLMKERTDATVAACSGEDASPFDSVEATPAARKRARKNAKEKVHSGELPPFVTLTLPRITLPSGEYIGPITMKIKSSLDIRDSPTVELRADILHYIREAMLLSQATTEKETTPTQSLRDKIRWRPSRKCWVAERDGQFKSFRPDDRECDVSVQAAGDRARDWQLGLADAAADQGDDFANEATEFEALALHTSSGSLAEGGDTQTTCDPSPHED